MKPQNKKITYLNKDTNVAYYFEYMLLTNKIHGLFKIIKKEIQDKPILDIIQGNVFSEFDLHFLPSRKFVI
jgi:hypothetical protein